MTYFNSDLVKFVNDSTTSKKSDRTQHSELYSDMRKLRTYMIISILCFNTNPSVVFFQTLIGLFCYAYGLRDKGFEILNAFGCSCSVDHIRRHGDYWSQQRSAIEELDTKKLWRVSFDNLNFKMKYSKDLIGDGGPKRALNLITGQVVHSKSHNINEHKNKIPTLRELSQNKLNTFAYAQSMSSKDLSENDFVTSNSDYYFHVYNQAVYSCTSNRRHTSTDALDSTLIEDLRHHLPHWTPPAGDKIVYTTVEEAGSASITDVASYLDKLKVDLHIGEEGYPKKNHVNRRPTNIQIN